MMKRKLGCLVFLLAFLVATFFFGRDYVRRYPQDFPWTSLNLHHPLGHFTSAKISALGDETRQCRMLLADAGVGDAEAPARSGEGGCGYQDGMFLGSSDDGRSLDYRPAPLVTSCPVAAALFLWEKEVVQPAARRHFGTGVAGIRHAGSYSCRKISKREDGRLSEHATADAVDVVSFQLANGESVSVLHDWSAPGTKGEFLRAVRDGACRIFSTVLSPDYNEAHRDHLHFDVAKRGAMGWTLCS